MHTAHKTLTWILMLLLLTGVLCNNWKVQYTQPYICAVKGSIVIIPCSFHYPATLKVQSIKWTHERNNIYTGPFIFDSESNKTLSRYQYIGDSIHNCSFKIHRVEHNDTGSYFFRFTTNYESYVWTGRGGSRLQVVDLTIFVTSTNGNETIKEGDSVNLTCINRCDRDGLSSAFTWYKNGEAIYEEPVLYFSNISSANSGNYTCSLNMLRGTTSGVVNIDVEYAPKNTSVSVTPSTELNAGSNITLTCITNANPPVKNYTWFKMGHDNVIVGNRPKLYLREIHPHDGDQFLCSVANKHGHQKSSTVSIKVKAYWPSFIRDALITVTVVLLIGTTVIAVRSLHKKWNALKTSQETEDIQNTVYANWPVFENSQSQEENHCEGLTRELIYASIDFCTERKFKMRQQVDSHDDHEDVIYSTVCRAQC
ncbi:B-cell receptor CD22-like isoform X1 [Channa argus]|uniref:B-cell receptor CD22-like isoform X1 n=1 Tax=Channa argus TaxID=215402 RepID=UPI00352016DE